MAVQPPLSVMEACFLKVAPMLEGCGVGQPDFLLLIAEQIF